MAQRGREAGTQARPLHSGRTGTDGRRAGLRGGRPGYSWNLASFTVKSPAFQKNSWSRYSRRTVPISLSTKGFETGTEGTVRQRLKAWQASRGDVPRI